MFLLTAQKHHLSFRLAVFFGVFGGLLFSSGEGIRLFPFPPAEVSAEKPASVRKSETGNAYQKNFHRFENEQASQKAKNQRVNPRAKAETFNVACFAPRFAPTNLPAADSFLSGEIAVKRFLRASMGSRAPPSS